MGFEIAMSKISLRMTQQCRNM